MIFSGRSRPLGLKIISILFYVFSVFLLLVGVLVSLNLEIAKFFVPTLGIGPGIVLLALGIIFFAIGRGLWKTRKWARIAVVIFVVVNTIGALLSIFEGSNGSVIHPAWWISIPFLIVWLLILWYLTFSKKIRESFGNV